MTGKTFKHDGYDLYYEAVGHPENPPLLMVHGFTMSAHVWRTTISGLEQQHYCVALDLLGHGRSPVDRHGDHSIEAQGRRVLALADHLGFERFNLIGHSMGGQIALCIAAKLAPERIIKLVDVDGVTTGKVTTTMQKNVVNPIQWVSHTPLVGAFAPFAAAFLRFTGVRFKMVARQEFAIWWHDFDVRDFEWWRKDREFTNRPGIHHTWYPAMNAFLRTDMTPFLPNIQCPTLVIFGEDDQIIPVSEGQVVAQHVPNCQLEIISKCGHLPMYECTDRYLEILKSFLA